VIKLGRTLDWVWTEIEKLNWVCDIETKYNSEKKTYKCTIKKYDNGEIKYIKEFKAGNKVESAYKALVWLIVNKWK
jgi:hypothetical protein